MTKSDGVARGGAAAVIGVGTGEVLALASYPTYDLSQWDKMYDTWSKDAALPMFNRATDGTYAPGSTFKLCTSCGGPGVRRYHSLLHYCGPGHLHLLRVPPAPMLDL